MNMIHFRQDILNEINNALDLEENYNEDGSVNWDFISSDVHIELNVLDGEKSDFVDEVLNNFADAYRTEQSVMKRAIEIMESR